MTSIKRQEWVTLGFRGLMAWVFLYAAFHQITDSNWSVAGFLGHTKTFHDVYSWFATPAVAPTISFLVKYGHLLIGLSLLFGLFVRASTSAGIVLMILYWTAHMDWPFIENQNNFLVSYHIIYAMTLTYLFAAQAGHVWGLDGWLEKRPFRKSFGLRKETQEITASVF